MKPYQMHLSGYAYVMTMTDGKQVVVTDRNLRDQLITSRLAFPAYNELPIAEFKSRYQFSGEAK